VVIDQANTLAHLRGWSPVVGLQIEYSLIERTAERELIQMGARIVYLIDGSEKLQWAIKSSISSTLVQGLCWEWATPAGVALQAIRAFGPDHLP
jgi:hypothetical protein